MTGSRGIENGSFRGPCIRGFRKGLLLFGTLKGTLCRYVDPTVGAPLLVYFRS